MDNKSKEEVPPSYKTCAACKILRRKCEEGCIFYHHFPPDSSKRFQSIHNAFGAHNVAKILSEINPDERDQAVNSLFYEAEARNHDPISGCVGLVSNLQRELKEVVTSLSDAKNELATFIGPEAVETILQQQFLLARLQAQGGNPSLLARMQSYKKPMIGNRTAGHKGKLVIREPQKLMIREPQEQQQKEILSLENEKQQHQLQVKQKGIMRFDDERQHKQGKQKGIMRFEDEQQHKQGKQKGIMRFEDEQQHKQGKQKGILRIDSEQKQHHQRQQNDTFTFNSEDILRFYGELRKQQQQQIYYAQQLTAAGFEPEHHQGPQLDSEQKHHHQRQQNDTFRFNSEDILRFYGELQKQQQQHMYNAQQLTAAGFEPENHQGPQLDSEHQREKLDIMAFNTKDTFRSSDESQQQQHQMFDPQQLTAAVVEAREQEDMPRRFEQHNREQRNDILTFSNEDILRLDTESQQQQQENMMFDPQQLTTAALAAIEEDLFSGFEQQGHQGQRNDILTFSNEDISMFDSEEQQQQQLDDFFTFNSEDILGFNTEQNDRLTFQCEDILNLINAEPEVNQGQEQDNLRLFEDNAGSSTAILSPSSALWNFDDALWNFDDPYQIQIQQQHQPHHSQAGDPLAQLLQAQQSQPQQQEQLDEQQKTHQKQTWPGN